MLRRNRVRESAKTWVAVVIGAAPVSISLAGGRLVGQGEEDVVEVGGVHGEAGRFEVGAVEAVEQGAQRADAAVAGHLEGEFLVVAVGLAEGAGGEVEFGGVGEAQADVPAGDQALQFGRGALGDEPAPVEHGDPVGELVGFFEVLGGEEDRHAVAFDEFVDELPHHPPAARVKAGGGFVQEDDPGLADQRHGQVEPAPHAAGIGGERFFRGLGQIEFLQQFRGASP